MNIMSFVLHLVRWTQDSVNMNQTKTKMQQCIIFPFGPDFQVWKHPKILTETVLTFDWISSDNL